MEPMMGEQFIADLLKTNKDQAYSARELITATKLGAPAVRGILAKLIEEKKIRRLSQVHKETVYVTKVRWRNAYREELTTIGREEDQGENIVIHKVGEGRVTIPKKRIIKKILTHIQQRTGETTYYAWGHE